MAVSHQDYFLSDKSCLSNVDACHTKRYMGHVLGFKPTSHFLYLIANCSSRLQLGPVFYMVTQQLALMLYFIKENKTVNLTFPWICRAEDSVISPRHFDSSGRGHLDVLHLELNVVTQHHARLRHKVMQQRRHY